MASRFNPLQADPRWNRVASSLHLPYDSASQFFRTYEGAPDSTLQLSDRARAMLVRARTVPNHRNRWRRADRPGRAVDELARLAATMCAP